MKEKTAEDAENAERIKVRINQPTPD